MEKRKENRDRLKGSLEVSHIRTMMTVYTITIAVAMGCWYLGNRSRVAEDLPFFCTLWGGFWGIIMVLYGGWLLRIFRKTEEYVFTKAKLVKLHHGKLKNSMYFTVVLDIPGSGKIVENTYAIFQTHGWPGPLVEDYVNQTVEIAYNLTTEQVVVIG